MEDQNKEKPQNSISDSQGKSELVDEALVNSQSEINQQDAASEEGAINNDAESQQESEQVPEEVEDEQQANYQKPDEIDGEDRVQKRDPRLVIQAIAAVILLLVNALVAAGVIYININPSTADEDAREVNVEDLNLQNYQLAIEQFTLRRQANPEDLAPPELPTDLQDPFRLDEENPSEVYGDNTN